MKKTKLLFLCLAVAMVAVALMGCGSTSGTVGDSADSAGELTGSFTVTDMTDKEIVFDQPVEKIVALTAADCEIIYALGGGDLLVGRGEYCDYPEDILAVPTVQSGADTNIEQLIALAPDMVLMSTMAQTKEQVAALQNAGIKVVVSDAQNIAGVYTAIELIGALIDKNDEAEAMIASMKSTFEEISAKCANADEKTVYFEVSPLEWGLWTAGNDTFMDELADMLELTNVFADVNGWAEISEEQVLQRNPDYIVTTAMYFGEGLPPEEEIVSREGWQNMKAIQNGAIFNVDSNAISRPGPRLADALVSMYDFIYGGKAATSAE
ncbi:MAG: ABC transporter substrate-binding protein [Clostridiales bacterium]